MDWLVKLVSMGVSPTQIEALLNELERLALQSARLMEESRKLIKRLRKIEKDYSPTHGVMGQEESATRWESPENVLDEEA